MKFKSLLVSSFTLSFCVNYSVFAGFTYQQRMQIAAEKVKQNEAVTTKQTFEIQGRKYVVFPGVFSPLIFPSSKAVETIPVHQGESFLEIGSGTGVFSVMAALEGASRVVAVDINPEAVKNTIENARLHHVEDRVTAIESDIFSAVQGQFDVIFWNIPFADKEVEKGKSLSLMELAAFDPGHAFLCRYLKEGAKYLNPGGRLLLGYSTTHGNIQRMQEWAKEFNWEVKLLKKEGDEAKDFITVELYEFTQKAK